MPYSDILLKKLFKGKVQLILLRLKLPWKPLVLPKQNSRENWIPFNDNFRKRLNNLI